ncbi:serine/threonine-protein kinase N1-like [Octopus sinensis]|uniref:Metalloendopeptidase n=1 Tax=Octopus sinensis TaxID=2607531 RepID=A0A7E6EJP4_9MOLL|nr:serine/threonine-protein kinase N1-like [Octopus sinensis]
MQKRVKDFINGKAKEGLNNMLIQFRQINKSTELEETQKMHDNVCMKIEVLQMQLKLFDIKKKKCGDEPDEFILHDLKNHLKIEQSIFTGANRAMEALSRSSKNKKSIRLATESVSKSSQKVALLKSAIKDITDKICQNKSKTSFSDNEALFDSLPLYQINSKVFPVTGSLSICINGCSDLDENETKKFSKSSKNVAKVFGKQSNMIYISILIDNKEIEKTNCRLPSKIWMDCEFSIKVSKAKELEFQVFDQEKNMCAVKYLLLEDFIDEKSHCLDLTLIPKGVLSVKICFSNPFINNTATLKRQKDLICVAPLNLELIFRFGVKWFAKKRCLMVWTNIWLFVESTKYSKMSSDTSQGPFKNNIDDYSLLKVLGSGNFGEVILCKDKAESLLAMKVQQKKEVLSRGEIDTLRVEMEVLRFAGVTKNHFLVNLISCFTTDTLFYTSCVLLGLKYLHEINILYRDLKLDNLMLAADGYVKIADFGLCKEQMSYGNYTSTFCGTPEFIAPEMLNSARYSRSIDWWQLGVLVYEMLAFQLLIKNPEKRLGNSENDAKDVMRHSFFIVKRAATSLKNKLWSNSVIYYDFDYRLFEAEQILIIRNAMAIWEQFTCLQFIPRSQNNRNYVLFTKNECGCCSHVGKTGGKQDISLNEYCLTLGSALHEIGHSIGFWHEHTRNDRDKYVKIIFKNIIAGILFCKYLKGKEYNFYKKNIFEVDSLDEEYDYSSIMHYSSNAFSIYKDLDTIVPLTEGSIVEMMGQRQRLSEGDIKQTNILYSCEIDECASGTDLCDQICRNTVTGYECDCYPGYQLIDNGVDCEGLILIHLKNRFCRYDYITIHAGEGHSYGKFCGNKIPSPILTNTSSIFISFNSDYEISGKGFELSFQIDINECSLENGNCSHLCKNLYRTYQCYCRAGYALAIDKKSCFEGEITKLLKPQTLADTQLKI